MALLAVASVGLRHAGTWNPQLHATANGSNVPAQLNLTSAHKAAPCRLPLAGLAAVAAARASKAALRAKATKAEKSEANDKLKKLQASMLKKYGEGAMLNMQQETMGVQHFSTGALTLDMALGGGLPFGRIIEIFGPEASGKTTTALSCIAGVQKAGKRRCAFIDAEQALSLDYAREIGVDTKRWDLLSPMHAEEATDMALELVSSGLYDLVVIDSVAALVPLEEMDKDMGQMTMGLLARLMSKFCRKITGPCKQHQTSMFFTNQLRANIGGYGPAELTCGGNAIKYFASVRMEVRAPKSGMLGPAETPYGIRSKVKVVKNKLASPHRIAEFDIIFGKGISWDSSVLEAAISKNIVEKAGAWFQYNGHKEQGKERFKSYLEANPKVCKELERACRAEMKKKAESEDMLPEEDGLPPPPDE